MAGNMTDGPHRVYPSGNKVIKTFTSNKFIFYDKNNHLIPELTDASTDAAARVEITWLIQKDHQNSLMITLASKPDS